jgi:hypothetical protein
MTMKSLIPALGLLSLLAFAGVSACDGGASKPPTIEVTTDQLKPGGVFIAHVVGCDKGCDQLKRGDLVLAVDGQPVTSSKDMRVSRIATGSPIKLSVQHQGAPAPVEVEMVAKPNDSLPPIKEAPPFWSVGAADLDKAPQWARRSLFGHASPMTMLVNAEGGTTDGRQFLGKKRLILFWDYATREEQAQAANMMQVLQKAQADLTSAGVEIMFTQIRFPGNDNGDGTPRQAPMNDTALRQYQVTYGVKGLPQLPMYRFPNAVEYNAARELGLEGASTYIQYLRASPAIILLDEGGIIRWHSEGIQPAPAGDTTFAGKDDQYTIVQAIEFAQKNL